MELSKKKKPINKKDEKEKEKDERTSEPKLQCLEVDNYDPLTMEEWKNFSEVVTETQGLGWF